MTDYTKLIERLRFYSRQGTRYGMAAKTMAEAVDSIEELQAVAERWKTEWKKTSKALGEMGVQE